MEISQFERGDIITIEGRGQWKIVLGNPHNVLLNIDTPDLMRFDPEQHVITDYTFDLGGQ